MASIEKIQIGGVTYDLSASGNYVEKTGDTMSGDLIMSHNLIKDVSSITFDSDGNNSPIIYEENGKLLIDNSNTIKINSDGQIYVDGANISISASGLGISATSNSSPNKYFATNGTIQEIPTPGDPNQNAFSKVKVGSTTINSTTTTDTLNLSAGNNVTLTPNTSTKTVTIAASGEANQKAFSTVAVKANATAAAMNLAAGTTTDTVTIIGGTGISLTPNAQNKTLTIASTGGGGNYLPLTGGTMSGDINMDYGYSLNNVNYVTNSLNPVYLQGVKGEVMVVDKAAVYPDNSLGLDLGTTSKLWNDIYANRISSTLGFFQTSDKNLKNIHGEIDLNKAYDLIDKCSTILYDLKDDPKHKEQIGVIAQEIEEFFPEIINTDENGLKSVDYARLTVVIMRVLKDLMMRVTNIESKLK